MADRAGAEEMRFGYIGKTRRVRLDRPWWRIALTAPFGCCFHATYHHESDCTGTWQRFFGDPKWCPARHPNYGTCDRREGHPGEHRHARQIDRVEYLSWADASGVAATDDGTPIGPETTT